MNNQITILIIVLVSLYTAGYSGGGEASETQTTDDNKQKRIVAHLTKAQE
tara:strand:+ start:335 stop:484 length:150 start_codon:yes stop_codon:yes gene_type:complete